MTNTEIAISLIPFGIGLVTLLVGMIIQWHSELKRKPKQPKFVQLFSVKSTTVDNGLIPKETLYFEKIYGITPNGKTKFIRSTMEYTDPSAATEESEMIMNILIKKYTNK